VDHGTYSDFFRNSGNMYCALKHAKIETEFFPDDSNAWFNLGTNYEMAKDHDGAVSAYANTDYYFRVMSDFRHHVCDSLIFSSSLSR
jgi:hypothetical protein